MKKITNPLFAKAFLNQWIVGIGVTVIGGLILYFGFGVGRPSSISNTPPSTIKNALPTSSPTASFKQDPSETISLRGLEPLETNKDVSQLSDGIYGYAYAFSITRFIKNNKDGLNLTNLPDMYQFEIQKNNGSVVIIGFIDSITSSKLGEIKENNPLRIMLFPTNWEGNKRLVSISIGSFSDVTNRDIDISQWKRMSILEGIVSKISSGNSVKIYRTDSI